MHRGGGSYIGLAQPLATSGFHEFLMTDSATRIFLDHAATTRLLPEAHAALAKRGIPLASNQVEYSLLHRQPETNGVLDACRELGITLIAYTPLAGGLLTGTYSAQNRPGGFFRRILPQYSRKALDAIQPVAKLLREIGERYSKTPSQVALRWLIENPIVLPIPGAKNG